MSIINRYIIDDDFLLFIYIYIYIYTWIIFLKRCTDIVQIYKIQFNRSIAKLLLIHFRIKLHWIRTRICEIYIHDIFQFDIFRLSYSTLPKGRSSKNSSNAWPMDFTQSPGRNSSTCRSVCFPCFFYLLASSSPPTFSP